MTSTLNSQPEPPHISRASSALVAVLAGDPDLETRLSVAGALAILGWAVRGAMAVIAGGLADPDRVRAATEDYRISEDTLASFVRDECLLGPGNWSEVGALRRRYERHAAEMGTEGVSAKALTMRLTSEFGVEQGRLSRPARRIYRGIGVLATDAESAIEPPTSYPQGTGPGVHPQPGSDASVIQPSHER